MEGKVIIEIKESINPFMTESDEKGRRKALQSCNRKEGRRAFHGAIVLTSGLHSALGKTPG
jgi:hypothetical protein